MKTCKFHASTCFFLYNCFRKCQWERCAHHFITKCMNMCFIFAFLNSFRSLDVVFDLEARWVVKKIQDYFLLLESGIILVSPFRLIYICSLFSEHCMSFDCAFKREIGILYAKLEQKPLRQN